MRVPPHVTVRDPRHPAAPSGHHGGRERADEIGDDRRTPSRARRTSAGALLTGALLLGCTAGLALARALPSSGPDADREETRPRLAVVTGRDATAHSTARAGLRTAVEVTLVNTGAQTLRVLGSGIRGTGLSWSGDRPLEPGGQVTAVLADPSPCARAGLDSAQSTVDLDVVTSGDRHRLSVPLPPTFLHSYDADVRARCGRPLVHEALWVALGGALDEAGQELLVPAVVLNRSAEPVTLLSVSSTLDGTSAVLRSRTGAPVRLPLTMPGGRRAQLDRDDTSLQPATSPYVVAVAVERGACDGLRARGGETVTVGLQHAYAEDPLETATTSLALDLTTLVGRACA